jgi:hypothetical protein
VTIHDSGNNRGSASHLLEARLDFLVILAQNLLASILPEIIHDRAVVFRGSDEEQCTSVHDLRKASYFSINTFQK